MMRTIIRHCLLAVLYIFLISCTFNYRDEALSGDSAPEMVMRNAEASRYEQAEKSVVFNAAILEVYDADRVWAAEQVSFVEYANDGTGIIELEGNAGLLLLDDKEGLYTLGNGTEFFIRDDGLRMRASDLQWVKKLHRLYGPETGMVEIIKDDGSTVSGTGFFANTLSRSYLFKDNFSGVIITGSDDEDGEIR